MATAERLQVESTGSVNLCKMPESQRKALLSATNDALERFFADPGNMAAFLEWEAQLQKTA